MVKLRAGSRQSYEASELNKISFSTKINLASAKGARLVLKARWTSRAILSPCIPLHHYPWCSGLRPGPCRISCRQNIYFCLIHWLNRQKYHFSSFFTRARCANLSYLLLIWPACIAVGILPWKFLCPNYDPNQEFFSWNRLKIMQ